MYRGKKVVFAREITMLCCSQLSLMPKNVVPWHWHSPSGLARPGPQWSRQPSFRPPVVVGHLFDELLRRNKKKVVVVTVDAIEC